MNNRDLLVERGNCRSCGAPIVWGRSAQNRPMPMNFPPDRRFILNEGGALELRATYASHFSTCPQAAQHRRSG